MCSSCLTIWVSRREVCNTLISNTTEWRHITVTWYEPYWMHIWLEVISWFCNRIHVNHNQLDTTGLGIRNSLCQTKGLSYNERNISLMFSKELLSLPNTIDKIVSFLYRFKSHFKDNKRSFLISKNVNLSRLQSLLSYFKVIH